MPRHDDPAERDGVLRFYYRGWRPTRFGRCATRIWAWLSGLGVLPEIFLTLLVKERHSAQLTAHVLAVVSVEGCQYLVSMLGDESNWVQDVRATNGAAFVKRGITRPVSLVEVPVAQRAPLLRAWCQIATSGRKHLPVPFDAPVSAFEAIAADYPVFRIDPKPTE